MKQSDHPGESRNSVFKRKLAVSDDAEFCDLIREADRDLLDEISPSLIQTEFLLRILERLSKDAS